jgi:predicted metal-dependent peptidase
MKPPTMATDGMHLYYHPDFVKNTPIAQLTGVIAHEIIHIVCKHIPRRQGRDPLRWNIASDYADNALVLKEFQLPPGVLDDPAYHEKSVEYIYSNLPMKHGGQGGGGGEGTLDSHEEWKNWGKGEGKDGDTTQDASDAMEQEWQQRMAMAATQARIKGKLPAHMEQVIGEFLQPKLDWKANLQDRISSCAKNDYRLSPASKRHLYRGFYLPSIAGEQITIACGVDDSGSISDEEIRIFLSEVKGICDSYDEYTIYLFIADAKIHQRFELHPFDPMPKVVVGRGGTDFRPVIEEADRLDISSLVYFTDLCGTFPDKEPRVPVIWVCTTEQDPPWGSVIRYPRENGPRRRKY